MNQIERLEMKIARLASLKPDLKPGFFLTESGYLGFNPGIAPKSSQSDSKKKLRKTSELKIGDVITSGSSYWSLHENRNTEFKITRIGTEWISIENMQTSGVYVIMTYQAPMYFQGVTS